MKKKFNRSLFFFAFLLLGLFFFARNDFTSVYAEEPETQDIQNESSEPGENTDDGSTTTDTTDTAEEPMENVPEEQPEEPPALMANTPDPVTEIYLNGQSGDDANDGTSEQNALKTFEKAKEFALSNPSIKTIWVLGQVNGSGELSLKGTNAILKRHGSYTGVVLRLIGNATLSDITIDGNKDAITKDCESLVVADGCTLYIKDGTVIQNNYRRKQDISSSADGLYANGGGLRADSSTVYMTGGIIQNNVAYWGAGVSLNSSTFNMTGGTIQNNHALRNGGGIGMWNDSNQKSVANIGDKALIQRNRSEAEGGGIAVGIYYTSYSPTILNMTGGKVQENESGASGGGIFVQAGFAGWQGIAKISGGYIINNKMLADGYGNNGFGGGGIYVNGYSREYDTFSSGELHLINALIYDNKADMEGGGYASCPSSETHIYVNRGAAFYQNQGSNAKEIYILASDQYGAHSGDPMYTISNSMLGGTPYHWMDDKGIEVPLNKLDGQLLRTLNQSLNLHTNAVVDAYGRSLAKVFIYGNYSATRGGGIGSNGTVYIGEYDEVKVPVKKQWNDADNKGSTRPNQIIIELYRTDSVSKEPVYVGYEVIRADADGNWSLVFKNLPKNDPKGNPYIYSVKERKSKGYTSRVTGDMENGFLVKNTISISISVQKKWEGTIGKAVKVVLKRNGEDTDQIVVLSKDNEWMDTFQDLEVYDEDGNIIEYSVDEQSVIGVDGKKYTVKVTGNCEDGFIITNTEETTPHQPKEEPKTPPYTKSVQTGLSVNGMGWQFMCILAGAMTIVLLRRKQYDL